MGLDQLGLSKEQSSCIGLLLDRIHVSSVPRATVH